MERSQKYSLVDEVAKYYNEYGYFFYVTYKGVDVATLTKLRRDLKDCKVKVVKNTLNKISMQKNGYDHLSANLKGSVVTVFANDPVETAKMLSGFLKDNKDAVFVAFGDKQNSYDAQYMQAISILPSLDELRGTLASLLVAPQRNIAVDLKGTQRKLAVILSLKK
jgi:large subunit ribosomal protein L10